jgi:hypothetical protein
MPGGIKVSFTLDPKKLLANAGAQDQNQAFGEQAFPQPVSPELTPNVAEAQTQLAQELPEMQGQPIVEPEIAEQIMAQEMAPSANLPDAVEQAPIGAQLAQPAQPQVAEQPIAQAEGQPLSPKELLLQQFQEKFREGQDKRRDQVDLLQKAFEEAKGRKRQVDLRPLAAFVDTMTGSKFAQSTAAPESPQARENRMFMLQQAINKAEQGLTQSEIDALKTQLMGGSKAEQRQQQIEGRQQRFNKANLDTRKDKLSKAVRQEGILGMQQVFDQMDKEVPGGIDGWNSEKDIPGIGGGDALLPTAKLGPEGRRMRQLTWSLGNRLLKARSGTAVTENEMNRILGELGFDQALLEGGGTTLVLKGTRSDKDWIKGIRDAKDVFSRTKNLLKAAYGDDAWKEISTAINTSTRGGVKKEAAEAKKSSMTEQDIDKMSDEELRKFVGE